MDIEDKIKHLLHIANDANASENEREQAYARAHSWMIKHGIKVSLDEDVKAQTYSSFDYEFRGVFSDARAMAVYQIILAYGSFDMVVSDVPHSSDMIGTIAGPRDQLKELASMLTSLMSQMQDEYKVWSKSYYRISVMSRSESKKERKSFIAGWGNRVAARISEIKQKELELAGLPTDLVLHTQAGASNHLESLFGQSKQSNVRIHVSESYYHGQLAGDRAQLRGALK